MVQRWQEGVVLFILGDKSRFVILYELGQKPAISRGVIPANAT